MEWVEPVSNGGSTIIDYSVEMDVDSGNIPLSFKDGITDTSYTWTGLTEETLYKFRVRARNNIGYSVYTSEVQITTKVCNIMTCPSTPSEPSDSSGDD